LRRPRAAGLRKVVASRDRDLRETQPLPWASVAHRPQGRAGRPAARAGVTDIAAVAVGAQPERVRAAAADRVGEIVVAGSLGDIRDAALRAEASSLWLLDSSATP